MRRELASRGVGGSADKKTEEAIAFKNRLVEYDRNAAQRTQVVDDQSDYFEIDSNAWLSPEVRGIAAFNAVQQWHRSPCILCCDYPTCLLAREGTHAGRDSAWTYSPINNSVHSQVVHMLGRGWKIFVQLTS